MSKRGSSVALIGFAAGISPVAPSLAQCEAHWTAYSGPQLDQLVRCLTVWDPDGPGPAQPVVVAGGNFRYAGATFLNFVGMWDGEAWRPMGPGVGGTVMCAATFDPDGAGPSPPMPVIGGSILNRLAIYTGSDWQAIGGGLSGSTAESLIVQGGDLIVGGVFYHAGGIPALPIPALHIARWDGAAWNPYTNELFWFSSFDLLNGSLYAGGGFQTRVGVTRWDGAAWNPVGTNYPEVDVYALGAYRGQLIAGGDFTNDCCANPPAPGERIALYDGAAWLPLGAGMNGPVNALCVWSPNGPGTSPDLLI